MSVIKGNICTLRPVSENDIKNSIIWRNDSEVKSNLLTYRLPITQPMEENWIEAAMNGNSSRIVFSIDWIENNTHVGFIELNTIDYFNNTAQFAIVLGEKNARGKGIAKEATQAIIKYAFDELNLNKIYLQVAAYNDPAIQLYTKIGFVKEGTLKNHIYNQGSYHHMIAMAIFKSNN